MADLTISFTIGEADVLNLAHAVGYLDNIPDPDDYTAEIPNTESTEDYLRRWIMERWQNDFATYLIQVGVGEAGEPILDIT